MSVDPSKWLEALKTAISTAGVYKFALAVVCGLYWLAAKRQWVPDAEPWELRASAFGSFLFGTLWLANVLSSALSIFPPRNWIMWWITTYRQTKEVERYIPYMTAKEREIIGYLLAKQQKSFIAARDGGHAMLLISRAVVVPALAPGQIHYDDEMPWLIPDHIWRVLMVHKEHFPYAPPLEGYPEPHPWRVSWMAR
jgi:hypothetical protein